MANRIIRITSALLVFALFFLWGLRGKVWIFFTAFWPIFHLMILAFAIALYISRNFWLKSTNGAFNSLVQNRYYIFPALSFIFTVLVSIFVFENIPHVIDASHFLWTARLMLDGHLSMPSSELYEYYENAFNINNFNGMYFSLFLPGFSLFLAAFELIGVPWLLVPLATGLSVLLVGKIADMHSNSKVSFLAMVLSTFSSFYIFMGASFMTHNFNLFIVLLSIYIVMKKGADIKWLVISGFILSILFFIRPHNAVFIYIPLFVYLVIKKNARIKELFFFSLPFAVTGVLLLLYNKHYTGDFMMFPQDIYFSIIEPQPLCHRMGLGKGCPNTEGDYLPDGGLTWSYAFWVAYTRLTLLLFNLVSHPYIFVFLCAAFLVSWKKNILIFSFFLMFFGGYFFFYLPGNLFGPRYFAEVASLLLIPAAYGFFMTLRKMPRILKPLVAALPLASITFLSAIIMPPLLERYSEKFWGTDLVMSDLIEERGIKNSVVFIPEKYHGIFLNMMKHPPLDKNGNLILKSLGKEDYFAAAYFMEKGHYKNAYKVEYYPLLNAYATVEEIEEFATDDIWVEMESKGKPATGKPNYINELWASAIKPYRFFPVRNIDDTIDLSNTRALGILFKDLNRESFYDFTHPILVEGEYEIEIGVIQADCGNEFTFTVNSVAVSGFNSYSENQNFGKAGATVHLNAGVNSFAFLPHQENSCLILDYIHFTRTK